MSFLPVLFTIGFGVSILYSAVMLQTSLELAYYESYYYLMVVLDAIQAWVLMVGLWAVWKLDKVMHDA